MLYLIKIHAFVITMPALILSFTGCTSSTPTFPGVIKFEEIPVTFEHRWVDGAHPFSGAAVIDVDGDGRKEIFIGGGLNQDDALLSYRDGKLTDIIDGTGLSNPAATHGPVSIDIDNDGDVDLLVARDDGVYLYINGGAKFSASKIPMALPNESVPLSIAISDIDHDGDADLYISVFVKISSFSSGVFNDTEHAKSNILLLNNGDATFTDITKSSNTAGRQNSFLSVFTDLDNDGWQDLVVSQNTGEVEIFRNNKDLTFTPVATNSGFGFWMGLAVGDIDKDGDQDLFFSNAGSSIPAFLTKGDLRDDQRHNLEWLLFRNDGKFEFSDVTAQYGIDGEGFAWGTVFEDLNLDGHLDLLVAQNYIKWPIHKLFKLSARSYLQTDSGEKLQHVEGLGLENPYYGQSPVITDLNNDGKPDLLWLNMDGPLKAFLNRSSGKFISVSIPERATLLGTRVQVETTLGKSYTREVLTSTGMLTDQTPDLVFGLDDNDQVKQVTISRPDGSTEIIKTPAQNTVIRLQP